MGLPISNLVEQPDDEEIQEKLSRLPAALFEKVVFHFDRGNNVVPPREVSQVIRAIELVQLARSRVDGITELWQYLQSKINASHQIKIDDLIGILMPPEEGESIVRYAFAQVKNSISSDIFSNPDEGIISTLVWNLANLEANPNKCSPVLTFAVLCHDHAVGLKIDETGRQLRSWIDEACVDTEFTLESIRAAFPRQDHSKIHRLSIEIAWSEPIKTAEKNSIQIEAFIRWGRLRQRIDQTNMNSDTIKEVTRLLESIKEKEYAGAILVDHAELVLDPMDMHHLWEYKDGLFTDIDSPEWQPFPIVVRSKQKNKPGSLRSFPKSGVKSEHIACNRDNREQFLARIQDHGVFVATKFESEDGKPCRTVRDAISWASIGIWSRKTFEDDEQLRDVITNQQIEDIPRRIHDRRKISDAGSVWRNIVVFFDPNLPQFRFSYELHDSTMQHKTNAALKHGFRNQ